VSPVLQLGPLALPLSLLLFAAAILVALVVGKRLGRRAGVDAEAVLLRMLLLGAVAARLGFIWEWRGPYLRDPLSMLDIRDGGWEPVAGIAAACLYGLARMNRQRALRRPVVAATLTALALCAAVELALLGWVEPGAPLPALRLAALDGRSVALADFAGKPTVVNLWATWCPPCRREMPLLQQAQAARPDIQFVFVNQGETPEQVARFLAAQRLPLRNVLLDGGLAAGAALGQRALPTTLFFDATGRLVSTRIGALSEATLAQRLEALRGPQVTPSSQPPKP
jgi:thiol-disulfide isomerase/thioredoxin